MKRNHSETIADFIKYIDDLFFFASQQRYKSCRVICIAKVHTKVFSKSMRSILVALIPQGINIKV